MQRSPALFLTLFISILLILFTFELLSISQHYLVIPWTEFLARTCSNLVSWFDNNAAAQGIVLKNTVNGFAVSIQPGCNGIEAIIVLTAAILAFPSGLKAKIIGLASGYIAIQLLNIIRIISLFYIGQWNESIFNWAHSYFWQAMIMLDVLTVFILWLRSVNQTPTEKTQCMI